MIDKYTCALARGRAAVCMLALAAVMLLNMTASAQVKIPRPSPGASVGQMIGVTEVMIKYSRPGVKGREIWGGLVPFDTVWRTGANEATTISFTDTVKIEGTAVPPGTYSLATIPTRGTWTVIFNKEADLWGAMGYKQENDILRITVQPEPGEHQEWMRFSFEDLTENSARVVLAWEELRVPFTIETPTHDIFMRSAKTMISPQHATVAANYLLQKKTDLEQAMKWIDLSLSMEENYANLRVKAQLLEQTGKKKDAIKTMEKALEKAKAMRNPPFDLAQMEQKLEEWKK